MSAINYGSDSDSDPGSGSGSGLISFEWLNRFFNGSELRVKRGI